MANGMILTPAEVAAQYTVKDGMIQDLGKFQFEPAYAYAFYAAAMEGSADQEQETGGGTGYWWEFKLSPVDTSDWPELAGQEYVRLHEAEDGFVRVVDWVPEPEEEEAGEE